MSCADAVVNRKRKTSTVTEVCSVRVGPSLFGMPICHILEIIGATRPQPVPLAPPYVGGLVHYRGDVLTTVSLRYLLGMPPVDIQEGIQNGDQNKDRNKGAQDILVIESMGGCFGLLVDSVGEVLTVSSDDFELTPTTVVDQRKSLLAGAYKLKDQLLVMLDAERLDPLLLSKSQAA